MPRRFSLPVRVCRNWHTQFVLQMSKTKSINFLQLILFALVIICRSTLDVSLEAYPLCGAVQSPLQKRSFSWRCISSWTVIQFLLISELATSYSKKSKFPDSFHYRKFTQKSPKFSTWKSGERCHFILFMIEYLR